MITVMVLICIFLVVAFIAAIVTGLIAISPILLLVICLPVLDYFVIKIILKNRKK